MSLTEFLFAQQNIPFAVAVGVMLVFALIEVGGLLFGTSASEGLDQALDVDAESDASAGGGPLAWLHFGSIPTFIFITLCSMGFGLGGYLVQWAVASSTGRLLPLWVAIPIALVTMTIAVRVLGGLLKKNVLQEQSEAVNTEEFTGSLATITLGETRRGQPTQAKLKDRFGTTHYVLIEPLMPDATFRTGEEVLLVERHGAVFKVIGRDDSLADVADHLSSAT